MSRSIIDEIIEPYTRTSLDICYTDISPPTMHRMPWHDKWRVVKWSKLIAWKKYDEIRDRAERVFDIMERNGAPCPTVQFYDVGGLQMEWENDGRQLIILIAPTQLLQYARRRTEGEIMINNPISEDEKFYGLLPVFAKFLYPPRHPNQRL